MATIVVNKKEYPFKVTKKLKELVKKADIKLDRIGVSKNETFRFAFLAAKASSEDGPAFPFHYEEFISLVEQEMSEKAKKLAAQLIGKTKKQTSQEEESA